MNPGVIPVKELKKKYIYTPKDTPRITVPVLKTTQHHKEIKAQNQMKSKDQEYIL